MATFKPRARQADKYRDRATERRGGVNDYADVTMIFTTLKLSKHTYIIGRSIIRGFREAECFPGP